MAKNQVSNGLKRIMMITLVLTFISVFTVVFLSIMMRGLNKEVKQLEMFVKEAKTTQPNFDKSLEIYTDQTEVIINYLLNLRPSKEAEYVDFISKIEQIGNELNLDLTLESVRFSKEKPDGTLNYQVAFQGGVTDLLSFLKKMEELEYYIRVKEIDYRNPKFISTDELAKNKNIKIKIGLYTK